MFEGNVREAPQIQQKTLWTKCSWYKTMLILFNMRLCSSTFRPNPGITNSDLPRRFQKALCACHSVRAKRRQQTTAKLSSAGAIISSVGAGGQWEVRRKSASTRNCPGDPLRSRCASPTDHWRNPRLLSPWLEEDCDGVSNSVSAAGAAAAAHHCLPCASVRQVPTSAGAGAPRGSNVTSCTTQARAWIWTGRAFVDACVQTDRRTHAHTYVFVLLPVH